MWTGVVKGKRAAPRRVLLYGTHGIGKSTWAASSPKPLVLATEDGLDDVGVDRTPKLTDSSEVAQWLINLGGEEQHGYQSVVIDTLDWLEKLIWQAVCRDGRKQSIEDFGYGKGYIFAMRRWERLLVYLDACRHRGLNVVLLAHAKVEKFSPPDADPYDRWQPDLHKTAAACMQEWCDEVLFAKYQVSTITKEVSSSATRTRAVGTGDRVVYTCEAPTHAAKRRIALPDTLPLQWESYQSYWPTHDIAGIVIEGHSKQKEVTDGKSERV